MIWLLLLCVLFASGDAFSQSQMRITLTDRSPVTVAVDGRYFNRRGTAITVGDLPPGRHSVKIYSIRHDRWGDPYQRIVFQGRVTTEYRMTTHVVYNPYTRMARIRQVADDFNGSAGDNNYARYKDGSMEESPTAPGNSVTTGAAASPAPMGSLSAGRQEALKKKVDAEKTDTKKLAVVKSGLNGETLSTMQVMTLMDWFLFESTKLDFAKWAYNITIDKQSYGDLSSRFEAQPNRNEFDMFVKKQGNH